ncbi:MAG: hypothetical protein PUJ68_00045 [[Actinobacillus] rossii]|nr:hypothetical protein [[Actinobacillus] rossii]MDY5792846.1 hypothetical protein [[Actinobacillus] rossii]
MAGLILTPEWTEEIYQLETSDPVMGGPDGIDNRQAIQLGKRTEYLKQEVEKCAPSASPAFTGAPTAPTAPQTVNNGQIATTAFVKAAIAALVGSAPATLDTLAEIAKALGDDGNLKATLLAEIGNRVKKEGNYGVISSISNYAGFNIELPDRTRKLIETTPNSLFSFISRDSETGENKAVAILPAKTGEIAFIQDIKESFKQSISNNGWCKLPNGLIFQWGNVEGTDVNFPIAFPNAVLNVQLSDIASIDVSVIMTIRTLSKTGFTVYSDKASTVLGGYFFFAIGY